MKKLEDNGFPDFGSEEWKKRYTDLLEANPELKKEYESLKAGK